MKKRSIKALLLAIIIVISFTQVKAHDSTIIKPCLTYWKVTSKDRVKILNSKEWPNVATAYIDFVHGLQNAETVIFTLKRNKKGRWVVVGFREVSVS